MQGGGPETASRRALRSALERDPGTETRCGKQKKEEVTDKTLIIRGGTMRKRRIQGREGIDGRLPPYSSIEVVL